MRPLSGRTVLEVGQIVSAPTTGLILGELGAEILKVEPPDGGDPYRELTPGNFEFLNHGKQSVALDLKDPEHAALFEELAATADLLVENLSPGAFDRLGLPLDALAADADLTVLSIKGYGAGPSADRVAMDYSIENATGITYATGLSGRPLRVGFSVVDLVSGLFGAIAGLSAVALPTSLSERVLTIGMFETGTFLIGQHLTTAAITGEDREPFNERGFDWAVYDRFETADGAEIFVGLINDAQFDRFVDEFDLDTLRDEKRFGDRESRVANEDAVEAAVASELRRHRLDDLTERLANLEVPFAPYRTPSDLLSESHLRETGKLRAVEGAESLRVPPFPIDGLFPPEGTVRAPALGADTATVLAELGYDAAELAELGVVDGGR